MQIVITGGGGFLGQRLAKTLLHSTLSFDELVLVDLIMPATPSPDKRVNCQQADLSEPGAAEALLTTQTGLVYHLAAIVSSHAESDFELGYLINLDVTRRLLEACRKTREGIRFIFSSSLAVFGGQLPEEVNDTTAVTPQSSYGIQKAMGELLVNDYTRKGFIEGLVLRLPTICVRPGKPNKAASSFVSSIIREPLQGEEAICPVSSKLALWLSSPDTVIENLLYAATLQSSNLGPWRTVNLPGIAVTVQQMLDSLEQLTSPATASLVKHIPDQHINRIVSSWPGKIDNSRALQLGFTVDPDFDHFIKQFVANDLQKAV